MEFSRFKFQTADTEPSLKLHITSEPGEPVASLGLKPSSTMVLFCFTYMYKQLIIIMLDSNY